jgi:integrase
VLIVRTVFQPRPEAPAQTASLLPAVSSGTETATRRGTRLRPTKRHHHYGDSRMSRRRGHGEGSIHPRVDGRWAATIDLGWENGKRKRKTVYGKTRKQVVQDLATLLKNRQDGVPMVPERKKLGTFLHEWLEAIRPAVRPRTWQRYEEYVRLHIEPCLGQVLLARLGPHHLQRLYANRLEAGCSAMSVLHLHRILHRAFGQACKWGLMARNVTELVEPPRPERKQMLTLSPEEARSFLDAARGDRLEALYVLAITAGLRQGELLALQWRDVDTDARTVRVTGSLQNLPGRGLTIVEPKTERSRRQVVVSELAAEALRRHRAAQAEERLRLGAAWEDHDLVFPNALGKPMNPSNLLTRSYRKLLARAGLPRLRFHDLRHTAATLLLGEGTNPKVVSEMLGHSTVTITLDLYSHVTPTMQQQAADALDALLSDPLAVNLAVKEEAEGAKPQVSPRSSGDRASVS